MNVDVVMNVDKDTPLPAPIPAVPAPRRTYIWYAASIGACVFHASSCCEMFCKTDFHQETNVRRDYRPTHTIRDDKAEDMMDSHTPRILGYHNPTHTPHRHINTAIPHDPPTPKISGGVSLIAISGFE